jgi:hypothetical protein
VSLWHTPPESAARGKAQPLAFDTIVQQAVTLFEARAIRPEPTLRLLAAFAQEGLAGPYLTPRRFSAINGDGVPFQWSLSLGPTPTGLRFIADCGLPTQSISERIAHTLRRIEEVAPGLGLLASIAPLKQALTELLGPAAVMDASLMGLCIGVDTDRHGATSLKVYVNTETRTPDERWQCLLRCLVCLGRPSAAGALTSLQRNFGDQLTPAFTALDLTPLGIGRLKLYFRPAQGCPLLAAHVAESLGCIGAAARIAPLHAAFLEGSRYPAGVLHLSVEFPCDGMAPIGMKLDVQTSGLSLSEGDVDARILALLAALKLEANPYRLLRDIVAASPARHRSGRAHFGTTPAQSLVFAGIALRGDQQRVNLYLHPFSGKKPRLDAPHNRAIG